MNRLDWPRPDRHFFTLQPDEQIKSALDSVRTRNHLATMFGTLFPKLLVVRPAKEANPKQLSEATMAQTLRALGSDAIIGGFITEDRATINGLPAYPSLGIFGVRSFEEKQLQPALRAYVAQGKRLAAEHPIVLLERLQGHHAAIGMARVFNQRQVGTDCHSTLISY